MSGDAEEESMVDVDATTDLGSGVFHFRAAQWQTNCLVFLEGDEAVVIDPAWTPVEVERIRRAAMSASGPIHFLLTPADVDHTCGMYAFQDAIVYGEPVSAELVENGGARSQLETQGPDWGMEFDLNVRVDEVIEPGSTLQLGPFEIDTVPARGHIMDGVAYIFEKQGVLVPGDYLSASMAPLVWWSVEEFRKSTERLAQVMRTRTLRWVVPGHGPLLCPADAIAIAEADVEYLRGLEEAAESAKQEGLSWADSMVRAIGVPLPRPSSPDIEIYAPQVLNAKRALINAGIHKPGEEPAEWGM
jgi:glyoxylase-like metal-dependent hydrolase (beta-lactamase superfamily II)